MINFIIGLWVGWILAIGAIYIDYKMKWGFFHESDTEDE